MCTVPRPLPERTGVFVVRIWSDEDSPRGLRARVTQTLDVSEREGTTTKAVRADEIHDLLSAWLDGFRASVEADP
jgi:hypothetical protein